MRNKYCAPETRKMWNHLARFRTRTSSETAGEGGGGSGRSKRWAAAVVAGGPGCSVVRYSFVDVDAAIKGAISGASSIILILVIYTI